MQSLNTSWRGPTDLPLDRQVIKNRGIGIKQKQHMVPPKQNGKKSSSSVRLITVGGRAPPGGGAELFPFQFCAVSSPQRFLR